MSTRERWMRDSATLPAATAARANVRSAIEAHGSSFAPRVATLERKKTMVVGMTTALQATGWS